MNPFAWQDILNCKTTQKDLCDSSEFYKTKPDNYYRVFCCNITY